MGDDKTQIGVEVKTALLEEFRQDVERRYGSTYGHMRTELERAMRAYLEGSHGGDTVDRLKRIEEKIDQLDHASAQNDEKKKDSDIGSRVESKLEDIIETVENEADGAPRVHNSVVEMAIQDIAGYSDPTIRQYKRLLKEREVVFEDPRSNKNHYYLDGPTFCEGVNAMVEDGEITKETYLDVLEGEYNREWWGEQVSRFQERQDETSERTPGFQ